MNDLENIYQQAVANVPRAWQPGMKEEDFSEKGHGFRAVDLIDEMVKRMVAGTDDQKREAAAALIERKTEQHGTVLLVTLPGHDDPMPVYPDQLYRWDDWLCESKNATVDWVNERVRQAEENARKAEEAARKAEEAHLDSMLLTGAHQASDGSAFAIADGWCLDLRTGALKRAQ